MVRKAEDSDLKTVASLARQLWPHHSLAEMKADFRPVLEQDDAAVFLAFDGETAVGFAQCGLRHDYVEGTDSSPVGYLEGIFVTEPNRRRGYAKLLLAACEVWAKNQGCTEFASDCELDNRSSLDFHLKMGFQEANRIICFTKEL